MVATLLYAFKPLLDPQMHHHCKSSLKSDPFSEASRPKKFQIRSSIQLWQRNKIYVNGLKKFSSFFFKHRQSIAVHTTPSANSIIMRGKKFGFFFLFQIRL